MLVLLEETLYFVMLAKSAQCDTVIDIIYTERKNEICLVEKGCPLQDVFGTTRSPKGLDKRITIKFAHCRCELVSSRKRHSKHLTAKQVGY